MQLKGEEKKEAKRVRGEGEEREGSRGRGEERERGGGEGVVEWEEDGKSEESAGGREESWRREMGRGRHTTRFTSFSKTREWFFQSSSSPCGSVFKFFLNLSN